MSLKLLNNEKNIVEKYSLEDIISIFCYDKTWKDFIVYLPEKEIRINLRELKRFGRKEDDIKEFLDYDVVCYVYVFDKEEKTCKELYLICDEDYFNKIIENNFEIKFKTISGEILINDLSEINKNGLNEDEIGEIYLKGNTNCLSINYGREDINYINVNNGIYRYKIK